VVESIVATLIHTSQVMKHGKDEAAARMKREERQMQVGVMQVFFSSFFKMSTIWA